MVYSGDISSGREVGKGDGERKVANKQSIIEQVTSVDNWGSVLWGNLEK